MTTRTLMGRLEEARRLLAAPAGQRLTGAALVTVLACAHEHVDAAIGELKDMVGAARERKAAEEAHARQDGAA